MRYLIPGLWLPREAQAVHVARLLCVPLRLDCVAEIKRTAEHQNKPDQFVVMSCNVPLCDVIRHKTFTSCLVHVS